MVVSTRQVVIEVKIRAQNEELLEEAFAITKRNIRNAVKRKELRQSDSGPTVGYIVSGKIGIYRVRVG
jgi:ribosomal protein S8